MENPNVLILALVIHRTRSSSPLGLSSIAAFSAPEDRSLQLSRGLGGFLLRQLLLKLGKLLHGNLFLLVKDLVDALDFLDLGFGVSIVLVLADKRKRYI